MCVAPESTRDELPVAEVQRVRLDVELAEVDPQHVARARAAARRTGPAGRSRRRPSRSRRASRAWRAPSGRRARRRAARARAPLRAPRTTRGRCPAGRSPVISRCAGATSKPAARSSATIPRGNARQPSTRSGVVELVALAEVERVDDEAPRRRGRDRDAALDRERHREPVVVVRVLADQVHAAGAERDDRLSQGAPASPGRPPGSRRSAGSGGPSLAATAPSVPEPANGSRHRSPGRELRLHEAPQQTLRLLRRIARLLAPGGGDDRVPHHRHRALAPGRPSPA